MHLFWYTYKNKSTQYWPENDSAFEVGPCKMQLLEETTYAFYTLRKFTVHNTKVRSRMHCVSNFNTVCPKVSFRTSFLNTSF